MGSLPWLALPPPQAPTEGGAYPRARMHAFCQDVVVSSSHARSLIHSYLQFRRARREIAPQTSSLPPSLPPSLVRKPLLGCVTD